MSQRNAQNARYTEEQRANVTRKSAAAMKPKAKAAASVSYSTAKSDARKKQEAKEKQKAEKAKERELNALYHDPPTEKYKKLRILWWGLLAGAVAMTLLSIFGRSYMPEPMVIVVLVLCYVLIVGALYVDLGLMRKERKNYRMLMEHSKTKEGRKQQKAEKAAARKAATKAKKQEAEEADDTKLPTVKAIKSK